MPRQVQGCVARWRGRTGEGPPCLSVSPGLQLSSAIYQLEMQIPILTQSWCLFLTRLKDVKNARGRSSQWWVRKGVSWTDFYNEFSELAWKEVKAKTSFILWGNIYYTWTVCQVLPSVHCQWALSTTNEPESWKGPSTPTISFSRWANWGLSRLTSLRRVMY